MIGLLNVIMLRKIRFNYISIIIKTQQRTFSKMAEENKWVEPEEN